MTLKQRLILPVLGLGIFASSMIAPSTAMAADIRDCDTNAVVYCGAYTKQELTSKINGGDTKNSTTNLKQIFYNEGRGITAAGINSAVEGTVYKDGRVVVNGKTVATGAMSTGREEMTGSVRQGSVWSRSVSTSFNTDSIPAWVNMDGGTFHWAILKSCGNTVTAKAVTTPTPSATPAPTPVAPVTTPTATPTPTPTPVPQAPLPETGGEGVLGAALGLGALGYGTRNYLKSRMALRNSLKKRS